MRSCICVFYIALFLAPAIAQQDPDLLYRERTDIQKAKMAADIWSAQLASDSHDFESAWKLARASYWLGGHGPQPERAAALGRGVDAAKRAAAMEPMRPEGYFWSAANMGEIAESGGMREGLRYRGAIKDALETVLRLDAAYQQGSADRALGRWYYKVPGLFGGSKTKSELHLRRSLAYNPNSTASHFFLAETLFALNRTRDGIDELNQVLAVPLDPEWAPEDREFKEQAAALLAKRR